MKENRSSSVILHFNKTLITDPKCDQGHYKRAMKDFEDALEIDHHHLNAAKYLHDVLNNIAKEEINFQWKIRTSLFQFLVPMIITMRCFISKKR